MTKQAKLMLSLTRTQSYAIAILGVVLVAAIRLALEPILRVPFFFFVFPIVLSCWAGGMGSGLLATGLSILLGDYLFVVPHVLSLRHVLALGFAGAIFSIAFDRIGKGAKAE